MVVGTVDPEVAVHVLVARYVEAGATVVQIGEAVRVVAVLSSGSGSIVKGSAECSAGIGAVAGKRASKLLGPEQA